MKTSNLSADNFKKYLTLMGQHQSPRYSQVILVSGALFWQLSIDHNIDVQYVCNISLPVVPNELESVGLNLVTL